MGRFGTTELIVIFLIVLILFGSRRLPEIGKGLGKGIQNFRKSLKGDDELDVTPDSPDRSAELPRSKQDSSSVTDSTRTRDKEKV